MKIAKVQFVPWDKIYLYSDPADLNLEKGDRVIVKTDLGMEIGWFLGYEETGEKGEAASESKPSLFDNTSADKTAANADEAADAAAPEMNTVIRTATVHDLEKLPKAEEKRKAIDFAIRAKEKFDLPMKIIDVHFSFDNSRVTFAFIADGRVDFREMVKELTRYFSRTIRLQQIGIRDEAKCMGDFGHCGQVLCCKRFLNEFTSITSEMADMQQCSHRGSERISGVCGRLMCCLYYEQYGYESLAKNMPPLGAKVNVDGKRGEVVGHHTLKQSVNVRFRGEKQEENMVVEVDLNRNKKKK